MSLRKRNLAKLSEMVWVRRHVTVISLTTSVVPDDGPSTSQPQTNDLRSRLGAGSPRLLCRARHGFDDDP